MAIFPVEVCDLIIDQVPITKAWNARSIQPNRRLESCAIVCRSWARHSRSRQFKVLDFSSYSLRTALIPFVELLSSPYATIVPHVRQIVLIFSGGDQALTTPILMGIASLRALESIHLRRYHITDDQLPQVGEITAWLGSFTNLRHMELSQFTIDSFSQLRDMICACRGLESLHIYDANSAAGWRKEFELPLPHPSPPTTQTPCDMQLKPSPCPPLQVLQWTYGHPSLGELFLEWVGDYASSLPLRSLCIGLDAVVRHQALLGRLLRTLGPTLKELSINSRDFFSVPVISYEHIDLRFNTQLEVLSLSGCTLPLIKAQFLDLTYQVSSGRLRELNISLFFISLVELNTVLKAGPESLPELLAIDTFLQHPNFAHLESLNIELRRVASMQEFFPRTAARNLLNVTSH